MLIHPTLVLCIGEAAKPLVSRLSRWTTDEVRKGFIFETFAPGTLTAQDICAYARLLTQSLPELESAGLTEVLAIQDFRVLIVFGTADASLLNEALETVHSAYRLLREQGASVLGLSCILIAFGPDNDGSMPRLLSSIKSYNGVSRRTLFYLSDWRGVVSTYPDDLRNATELVVALILLSDVSPAGRISEFWRDADKQAYWVGIEQFRFTDQDKIITEMLSYAVMKRLSAIFQGKPISQFDRVALINTILGPHPRSATPSSDSLEASQLRTRYSQTIDTALELSSEYVGDVSQLAQLMRELADMTKPQLSPMNMKETSTSEHEVVRRTWWRSFLLWLQRVFSLRSSASIQEASSHNHPPARPGGIQNAILSEFLSSLANSLSSLPRPTNLLQDAFDVDYSMALPHDTLCVDFQLLRGAEAELREFAEAELNSTALSLFQYLVINSLIDSGLSVGKVREADAHRTKVIRAIKKRLQQLWIDACIQEHMKRRASGRWSNYLFCNAPPPAPELFEIFLGSFRDQSAPSATHPAVLPRGLLFYATFVRIR